MAADLVRRKVDVIVASSQAPALAAKAATTTIPIVMVNATDPVQAGLVASLARPGGNVTGLSEQLTPEIRAKQLQLLKETLPRVARVAVLHSPSTTVGLREYEAAAQTLELRIQFVEVKSRDDLGPAFTAMAGIASTRCWCRETPSCSRSDSASPSWPASTGCRASTRGGSSPNWAASCPTRRASPSSSGAPRSTSTRSSEAPARPPCPSNRRPSIELVINLKTAKALGLAIPPALLVRADKVIQ